MKLLAQQQQTAGTSALRVDRAFINHIYGWWGRHNTPTAAELGIRRDISQCCNGDMHLPARR
jgi:hypothetical protein